MSLISVEADRPKVLRCWETPFSVNRLNRLVARGKMDFLLKFMIPLEE